MYAVVCYDLKRRYYHRKGRCIYDIVISESPSFRHVQELVLKLKNKVRTFYYEDQLGAYAFVEDIKDSLSKVFSSDLGEGVLNDYITHCSYLVVNELERRLRTSSKKKTMYLILIFDLGSKVLYVVHSKIIEALTANYDWVTTALDKALNNAIRVAVLTIENGRLRLGYRNIRGSSNGFIDAFGLPKTIARPEVGVVQVYGRPVRKDFEIPITLRCDFNLDDFLALARGEWQSFSIKDNYLVYATKEPFLKIIEIRVKDLLFKDVREAIDFLSDYEALLDIDKVIREFAEVTSPLLYPKLEEDVDTLYDPSTNNVIFTKGSLFNKYAILLVLHKVGVITANERLLGVVASALLSNKELSLLFRDVVALSKGTNYLRDSSSAFIGPLALRGFRNIRVSADLFNVIYRINEIFRDCTSQAFRALLSALALLILAYNIRKEYPNISDFFERLVPIILRKVLSVKIISMSESEILEFKEASFFMGRLSEVANRLVNKIASSPVKIIVSAKDDGTLSYIPLSSHIVKSDSLGRLEQLLKSKLSDYQAKVYCISTDRGAILAILAFRKELEKELMVPIFP